MKTDVLDAQSDEYDFAEGEECGGTAYVHL